MFMIICNPSHWVGAASKTSFINDKPSALHENVPNRIVYIT